MHSVRSVWAGLALVLVISASVVASGLTSGPVAAATPSLVLAPRGAHPDQEVTAKGTGYPRNMDFDVLLGQQVVGSAHSTSTGSLQVRFGVPASALPGLHRVWVRRAAGGRVQAATRFWVTTAWREAGFDPQDNSYNPYENVLSPSSVSGLHQVWDFVANLPGQITFHMPGLGDGMVFVGDDQSVSGEVSSNLWAVNASTGQKVWSVGAQYIQAAPTVSNGIVYVNDNGALTAYDDQTGTVVWRQFVNADPTSSPQLSGGVLYTTGYTQESFPGGTTALDVTTGAIIWHNADVQGYGTPAIDGGDVFVANGSGVTALDAATGQVAWTNTSLGMETNTVSATVGDGMVYVELVDQTVRALDESTGAEVWSTPGQGTVADANGLAYITNPSTGLYEAVNDHTGAEVWAASPTADISDIPPVIANGLVYEEVGDVLDVLDASTGALDYSSPVLAGGITGFIVANGNIYLGTDGGVYDFSTSS